MATTLTNNERAKQMVDEAIPTSETGPSPQSLETPALPDPTSSNSTYVPGPIGRGLQSALIQSAFQSFGEAFHGGGYTPVGQGKQENPGVSAFRQAGAGVAQALEMRWHQAEFGNFRKQQLAKFQQDAQGLLEQSKFMNKELNRGIWHESDGSVTQFDPDSPKGREKIALRRGELEADTITRLGDMQVSLSNEAAEKYGDNPLVNKMIANMYLQTSGALLSRFNPENTLAAEKSRAEIRGSEAQTQATYAQTAANAQQQKAPKTFNAAWQEVGPQGMPEWIDGTEAGQTLWSNVREGFVGEVQADAKATYWRAHKNLSEDEKERGWAAEADQNRQRFEKIGKYRWVASMRGEEDAKAFQEVNPGYGPDAAGPITPAVKGRELKPAEMKKKAKQWGQIALNEYQKYMETEDTDITKEDGIDYVMNEWFQQALTKGVDEGDDYSDIINDELTASNGQAAAEYRSYVTEYLKGVLEKHAGAGSALPSESRGTQQRARSPRGGLGRAAASLFGADIYPPTNEIPTKKE